MTRRPSLACRVAGLIDRTYEARSGIRDVAPYIVGDCGWKEVYRQASNESGARTLVRDTRDGVRASVYLPDELVRLLERHPPQAGLHEENLQPFATFIEELDHLVLIAGRARSGRAVSLFELELHADVTKYLVLARFLAGGAPRLTDRRRVWLRHHLFETIEFVEPDEETRDRYREARRHAVRFLDAIHRLGPARRLRTLRRFHRADGPGKVRMIEALAA